MPARVDADFLKQLRGYSLTTADILYRMPDHPVLLQEFIWQDYDVAPKFPRLQEFLGYWETHLEGKLYQVRVAYSRAISPRELCCGTELRLH